MHSYVYQVSLQPIQSESYAKAGYLPDWFYEQVCSYAENADPSWREQAIQELAQFLGPLCTRTGSRLTFNPSLRDGFFRRGYVCFKASARFLANRFPSSVPRSTVALPENAAALVQQYDEASQQIKALTERKQEAENLLKEMLGDHETGTAGDYLVTWKNVVQERLDTKTLKAEHPALYKKYASKTNCRRFTVKTL